MKEKLLKINEICLAREAFFESKIPSHTPSLDHIMAWLYLIPIHAPNAEQMNLAAGFLFLQISRNCHEDVKDKEETTNGKLVLLGDLFVSHAYRIVIENDDSVFLSEVSDIVIKTNEAWFALQKINTKDDGAIRKCLDNEMGLILKKCAEKGGKAGAWEEEKIALYKECAEDIAYLWGCLKHDFSVDKEKEKAAILKKAANLGIVDEIENILALLI